MKKSLHVLVKGVLLMFVFGIISINPVLCQTDAANVTITIDGAADDWISAGVDPLLDTDSLQTDSELKLKRFFIAQDETNFYFGFDAPATNKGLSYGLYIDTDNTAGSGGTSDRWGKAVAAVDDHLPEIIIYGYHKDDDTWSSSSPKYYSWDADASDWVGAEGGMGTLPDGGTFAIETTNRFYEIAIPKTAPGFNGAEGFFVELFTVGSADGAAASESIPSDANIQFTVENESTDVTTLSAFYGFNMSTNIESNIFQSGLSMKQNYPNPFKKATMINYSLGKQANISIKVYDLMGKLETVLIDETVPSGTHQVILNRNSMTPGIYFYRLTSGKSQITKKLMLVE